MLGLLLIYFLGRRFYDLALLHSKSGWGFAILGVVIYYGGLLLAGVAIGVIYELTSPGSIDEINDNVLGLMALPFGVLIWWLAYLYTKKRFENNRTKTVTDSNLLDDSFID